MKASEFKIADILTLMREAVASETLPERADGTASTIAARTAAAEATARIAANGGVMFVCTACGSTLPITEALPCVCGGFVCKPCADLETDGVCEHEPSDALSFQRPE